MIRYRSKLSLNLQRSVLRLIEQSDNSSFYHPVSEKTLLNIRHNSNKAVLHLIYRKKFKVIAYAHVDLINPKLSPVVEIVIDPKYSNYDFSDYLIKKLFKRLESSLYIWLRSGFITNINISSKLQFEPVRKILIMEKKLINIEKITVKNGQIKLRNFISGIDENNWLRFHNLVFKDHPDQSGWNQKDLSQRLVESWFDKNGFFIALIDNLIVGSIWTKIHNFPPLRSSFLQNFHAIGEIYITAVHPKYEGFGLGRTLTLSALNYLKSQGLDRVILYVDSNNTKALTLYKSIGFTEINEDVLYKLKY